MLKWILIGAGCLVGLVIVLFLIGLGRPRGHVAKVRARFMASAQKIFATLSDLERWPEWNAEMRAMMRQPDRDGHAVWLSKGKWGDMPMEIRRLEPPRLLETFVRDPGGTFQGTWTYEVEADETGCRVMITERGDVNSAFFRAMMLFHDNHATARRFLESLARRLGEEVSPESL